MILLPASIRKIKDVLFAIEAMSTVLLSNPNHYFFICGSIREAEYYKSCDSFLQAKIQAHPSLINRIGIIDYILYDDFMSVLKETDLVLNTSFAEGMSGSIIEAQLSSVPVLVRNNDGNMVLVKDQVNGLLFGDFQEFYAKYELVWSNPDLVENLRKNGLESVKRFDFEREKQEYVDMVTEVQRECYKDVEISEEKWKIMIKTGVVHQVFKENNELFNVLLLKNRSIKF